MVNFDNYEEVSEKLPKGIYYSPSNGLTISGLNDKALFISPNHLQNLEEDLFDSNGKINKDILSEGLLPKGLTFENGVLTISREDGGAGGLVVKDTMAITPQSDTETMGTNSNLVLLKESATYFQNPAIPLELQSWGWHDVSVTLLSDGYYYSTIKHPGTGNTIYCEKYQVKGTTECTLVGLHPDMQTVDPGLYTVSFPSLSGANNIKYGSSTFVISEIGEGAFENCKLIKCNLPSNLKDAWKHVGTYPILPLNILYVRRNAFHNCSNMHTLMVGWNYNSKKDRMDNDRWAAGGHADSAAANMFGENALTIDNPVSPEYVIYTPYQWKKEDPRFSMKGPSYYIDTFHSMYKNADD